ncbi:right-handed parallel beta-helix repeat-containing protein [Paludibacter sp.]|uniref:right-handed parallel beta-helix repeat-containing protein n=1 Tax=Paludibacter sp. TaxID=1898105 RepID=UPI0013560D82|nr:right-handed parallel beta-helix repeat-containing protein [Paludibacter sp.]MTK52403.1 T9SS type A sorting domain-containing protein [Paludibacter sp.]
MGQRNSNIKSNLHVVCVLLILLITSSTISAATKTWNGGTGTNKNWNTASNWLPSGVPATNDDVVFNTAGTITFSSLPGNISYNSLSINQGSVTLVGTTRTFTLGGNTGVDFLVASGAVLTITNINITLANNSTATINGTLNVGSGRTFTTNGTNVVTTVNGSINNSGTVTCTTASKLLFQTGAIYQHAQNGGTIPTATWDVSSTCLMTGITSTIPLGLSQSFGNFTWNCTGQTGNPSFVNNLIVNGDFTLNAGTFTLNSSTAYSLTIGGNYIQTGGVFDFNKGTFGTSNVSVSGNFSNTAGSNSITTTGSGAPNGNFIFNGTNQTLNMPTSDAATWTTYTINPGSNVQLLSNITLNGSNSSGFYGQITVNGTLDVGSYTITDTGTTSGATQFNLNSGGTLITANTNGVNGTIPSATTTKNLNASANYIFDGTSAQVTGTLLANANNLTVTNPAGVTLSSNVTVSGNLSVLTSGTTLNCDQYQITGNSTGTMTMDPGTTLTIGRNGQWDTTDFPTNFTKAHISLDPTSTVIYYGGYHNSFSSSPNYGNLIIACNSGMACVASGDLTVNGNLTINANTTLSLGFTGTTTTIGGQLIDNGSLVFTNWPVKTVTVSGNLSGTGTIDMTQQAHILNLKGQNNSIGTLTTDSYNSIVNYGYTGAGTQQVFASPNYQSLTISGGGAKALQGAVTVSNTLSLSSGVLSTTTSNLLTIANTATTAIAGGSTASYVNGPIKWVLPANLTSGSTYMFPIGNTTYLPFVLVNPITSGTSSAQVQAFNAGCGGLADGTTITAISNTEYWSLVTGSNFTGSSVAATRQTAITPNNAIAGSALLSGTYVSLNGTGSTYSVSNSDPIGSNRYFVLAATVPTILVAPTSASFSGVVGYNSSSQSFVVTTKKLTASITISAPSNYQVSNDNSTWGNNTSLTTAGGTLYVRYVPVAIQSSVVATVTLSSSGAADKTISLTGAAYKDAVYVRQNGYGTQDGTTWSNAMPYIQQAVETSSGLPALLPVYVAAGSYSRYYTNGDYATYSSGNWNGWANAFVMRDGVSVYGAFPENNTTDNNSAGFNDRVTLTSGSSLYTTTLNGNTDVRVVGPAYSVTPLLGLGSGFTTSTTWDGFTITGAKMATNNGGGDDDCGAGAFLVPNATLNHCIIENNKCTDSNTNDGAGAEMYGGALYNCIIRNNSVSGTWAAGGAINIHYSGAKIVNCLIYKNSANMGGGAIALAAYSGTNPNYIINNTIANNTSPNTSASGIQMFATESATTYLYNNVVWGNAVTFQAGTTTENYNAWPNGYTGTGANSFTLGSGTNPAGFVNVTSGSEDFRLASGSALINKGSGSVTNYSLVNGMDIRGVFRDATPDLGCYEQAPRIYYVNNASANANANGRNWTTPYKTLQAALDQCDSNDYPQIWVAKGSGNYTPSRNASGSSSTGADALFILKDNMSIYGGFSGTSGTEPSNYGDIATKINGRVLLNNTPVLSGNNISNALISYNTTANNAIIDGFTLTGTTGGVSYYTATIPANAIIQNCKIRGNATSGLNLAGTAYNVVIADNTDNTATKVCGINLSGNANLINATIANNAGVAINSGSATATVTNTVLWNNSDNVAGTLPNITYSAASSNYASGYTSNIWNANTATTHNFELYHRSPNFKDPANGDYSLLLISPCLGKGLASSNPTTKDANGNPRKNGTSIDIGAFQKWDGYKVNGSGGSITKYSDGTAASLSDLNNSEVMLNPGTTLNISGTITPSILTIYDDNTTSPIITCAASGSLTANKAFYMRKFKKLRPDGSQAWTFFGVPYDVNVNNIDGAIIENTARIEPYTEKTRADYGANKSAWTTRLNTSNSTMHRGTGYALQLNNKIVDGDPYYGNIVIFPSAGAVTFSNGDIFSRTLEYDTNANTSWFDWGWNFISNPFPQIATIEYSTSNYWPLNSSGTTDPSVNAYGGGVYTYDTDIDTYDIIPLTSFYTRGLAPFAGCFIKNGANIGNIQFKQLASSSNPLKVKSFSDAPQITADTSKPMLFHLHASGNNKAGNTYVLFHPNAHASQVEVEDSPNWSATSNGSNIVLNTFAEGSSLGLGINMLPFTGNSVEIPLQVSVPAKGDYTITLPEKDSTLVVYIKDDSGSLTNLNLSSYTFSVADASSVPNFALVFRKKTGSLGENTDSRITFIQSQTNVAVYGLDVMKQLLVYTPTGQLCKQKELNGYETSIDLPSTPGVYLVKIVTNKGSVTKKIINP